MKKEAKTFYSRVGAPTVDVWGWELDPPQEEIDSYKKILSGEEQARAARFHFPLHRRRFIAAHGRLRVILGERAGLDPAALRFASNPEGKPFLTGPGEGLHFNLSHAHERALLGVSEGGPLGVDIEYLRPLRPGLAERNFAPAEIAALAAVPPPRQIEAFFTCWTRKEAYIKAVGRGLHIPLDSFEVSLDEPARLCHAAGQQGEAAMWRLMHLTPAEGYVGAIAMRHPAWRLEGLLME